MLIPQRVATLIEVIINETKNNVESLNYQKLSSVRNCIYQLILNKISLNDARVFCLRQLNSSFPVDEYERIMNSAYKAPITTVSCGTSKSAKSRNKSQPKKAVNYWTKEEDRRLIFAVFMFGDDAWAKIAQFVSPNRTRSTCLNRWLRVLDPKINKGAWTPQEEEKLIQLVNKYGTNCWSKIASIFGSRNDVQCRYRYSQIEKKKKLQEGGEQDKEDEAKPESIAIPKVDDLPFLSELLPIEDSEYSQECCQFDFSFNQNNLNQFSNDLIIPDQDFSIDVECATFPFY